MDESKYKFKEMPAFSTREGHHIINTLSIPDGSNKTNISKYEQEKKSHINLKNNTINVTYNIICVVSGFKELTPTNHNRKKEWTKRFKEINSNLASNATINVLRDQIKASERFIGEDIYTSFKMAIKEASELGNQDDFIYSSLNMLSKYHEISETHGVKKLYLNRDKNLLSIDIIKEINNYAVTLSMMFSPNGNVSFFTHDSDSDDGYSVSGYMTPSKKYSSVRKIRSILNLLNQGER